PRAHSARPSHSGDHVDRVAAAAAAAAARGPHPVRERRGLGLYGRRAGGNVYRLSVRTRARAAAGRLAGGAGSALDRHRGRVARLRHPPPARGAQMSELYAYTLLVLVGFLPSEIWRMLGLVAARGIADESELFMWVRAVAIAVLAGVIAKIILFPPGTLATVPLLIRLAAIVG